MEYKITIHTPSTGNMEASISTDENPMTANLIEKALPFESKTQLWGDEIYFNIPVKMTEENARVEVESGDLAFWPAGSCMCIFFGRTPASRGENPAAASPVNVFGKFSGDIALLLKVKPGEVIRVERS